MTIKGYKGNLPYYICRPNNAYVDGEHSSEMCGGHVISKSLQGGFLERFYKTHGG